MIKLLHYDMFLCTTDTLAETRHKKELPGSGTPEPGRAKYVDQGILEAKLNA